MASSSETSSKIAPSNGSITDRTRPLYSQALDQFDILNQESQILYAPYGTTQHRSSTFPLVFQLAPHLNYKPVLPANAPERHSNNVKTNPFANPDPQFVLPFRSETHTLMLNKYCVYRPQLLLITKTYLPQYQALDDTDIKATWDLISQIEDESDGAVESSSGKPRRMLAFYNCGAKAGSSQGHKHVQLMDRPNPDEIGFELFPNMAESEHDIAEHLKGVPHKHSVLRLSANAKADDAIRAYGRLLARMQDWSLQQGWRSPDGKSDLPHNVVLTKEWVCIVPRRSSGISRHAMSNALGMIGVMWITHPSQISKFTEDWGSLDSHMAYLGYPV